MDSNSELSSKYGECLFAMYLPSKDVFISDKICTKITSNRNEINLCDLLREDESLYFRNLKIGCVRDTIKDGDNNYRYHIELIRTTGDFTIQYFDEKAILGIPPRLCRNVLENKIVTKDNIDLKKVKEEISGSATLVPSEYLFFPDEYRVISTK